MKKEIIYNDKGDIIGDYRDPLWFWSAIIAATIITTTIIVTGLSYLSRVVQ